LLSETVENNYKVILFDALIGHFLKSTLPEELYEFCAYFTPNAPNIYRNEKRLGKGWKG